MRKLKILYMNTAWAYGGIEAYMQNVFNHIDRTKYILDVAIPATYEWRRLEDLTKSGINVIRYPANSLKQQIEETKKILNDGDYDIVHIMQNYLGWETHTVFALVAIAERKNHHYKVICHAHSAEDKTKTVSFFRKMIRSVFRNTMRWCFSHADLLAACSKEAGEFLYGQKKDIAIFRNGIDLSKFRNACYSSDIPQWREKYGIHRENVNFVTVARLADQKNPIFLLDVVNILSGYYPAINLIWAGTGEMRKDIEAHVERLGITERVHLLGPQDHVEEILACCDYFLLPSKFEGLPLTFIEAQAAGLRCFTSDRVPTNADCGGVAFISLDKTADQWAKEICRRIEAETKPNIDTERLERFDINNTVAELSEVYMRLVEC